jgi:hypothetical protein
MEMWEKVEPDLTNAGFGETQAEIALSRKGYARNNLRKGREIRGSSRESPSETDLMETWDPH